MLPYHLCLRIYRLLSLTDQLSFIQANALFEWTIDKHISIFFADHGLDWAEWKQLLKMTEAQIKGSFALLLFSPTQFQPNDIDVYITSEYIEHWRLLLDKLSYFQSDVTGDYYSDQVFTYKTPHVFKRIRRIQLVVHSWQTIDNTANLCSIRWNKAICECPTLTKKSKILWCWGADPDRIEKYTRRGFTKLSFWEYLCYMCRSNDLPRVITW